MFFLRKHEIFIFINSKLEWDWLQSILKKWCVCNVCKNKQNTKVQYMKSSDAKASKYVWHVSLKRAFLSGYYV